jgi:hypothetical protein
VAEEVDDGPEDGGPGDQQQKTCPRQPCHICHMPRSEQEGVLQHPQSAQSDPYPATAIVVMAFFFLIFFSRRSRNKDIKHMTEEILEAITKPKEVPQIMTSWQGSHLSSWLSHPSWQ